MIGNEPVVRRIVDQVVNYSGGESTLSETMEAKPVQETLPSNLSSDKMDTPEVDIKSKTQTIDDIKMAFVFWARDEGLFSFKGIGRPTKQNITEAYDALFMPNVLLERFDTNPERYQNRLLRDNRRDVSFEVDTDNHCGDTENLTHSLSESRSGESVSIATDFNLNLDYKKILSEMSKQSITKTQHGDKAKATKTPGCPTKIGRYENDEICATVIYKTNKSTSMPSKKLENSGMKIIGQVVKIESEEECDNFEKQGLMSTNSPEARCNGLNKLETVSSVQCPIPIEIKGKHDIVDKLSPNHTMFPVEAVSVSLDTMVTQKIPQVPQLLQKQGTKQYRSSPIASDTAGGLAVAKTRRPRRRRYTPRRRTRQAKLKKNMKKFNDKSNPVNPKEDIYSFHDEKGISSNIKLNQAFPRNQNAKASRMTAVSNRVKSKYYLNNHKKAQNKIDLIAKVAHSVHRQTIQKKLNLTIPNSEDVGPKLVFKVVDDAHLHTAPKRRRKMAKPQKSLLSLEELSDPGILTNGLFQILYKITLFSYLN